MYTKRVGVIGGGMIGASMACLFAGNRVPVTLVEQEPFLPKAKANCASVFSDLIAHDLMIEEQRRITETYIEITADYNRLADVEFIFECVFERTDVKHAVYRQLEPICHNLKAIASSTSAISADELANGFTDPEMAKLLVVAHPWNPPHLAPCVEIVKSQIVAESAVEFVDTFLTDLGKKVVVMLKNIPGFIGNRLQYAMLREAIHMVEEGAATPEMIDETLKYSFAPRYTSIGIFEHFDNCGQDLTRDICEYLFPDLCDAKVPQKSLADNCAKGHLGVKSGKGMLDWEGVDIEAFRSRAAQPYYRFCDWNFPTEPKGISD